MRLPAGARRAGSRPCSQADQAPATTDWTWTTDANVFSGYNYQQRQFADFWAWESQNWVMLAGERAVGPGTPDASTGMLSLEPWTIGRLVYAQGDDGSPQRLYAFNDERRARAHRRIAADVPDR